MSSASNARSGLRLRRPSQDNDSDEDLDPLVSVTAANTMPETSRGYTVDRSELPPLNTDGASRTGSNWAGAARTEAGTAMPSGDIESGLSSRSPAEGTPAQNRATSALKRPKPSPNSPVAGERGYSLRRVLFAKTLGGDNDGAELGEAGPSRPSSLRRFFSGDGTTPEKKSGATVTVASIYDTELPPRPYMRKQPKRNFVKRAIPYDVWALQTRKSGIVMSAEAGYNNLKKRILKIVEIPPSKDGRHLDLDASRTGSLIDERTNRDYVSNIIRSSRYTWLNFLPRQLLFQFGKIANFYFLVISILQMVPGLSTTGNYTTIVPLLVFISISMAKEGYDDLRRHKLDKSENNKETSVLHAEQRAYGSTYESGAISKELFTSTKWQDVKVGDIIKLERDEAIPADMVILHSDGPNGIAYIETMALDGETNLKAKQASPLLAKRCGDMNGLMNCNAHIVVEDPNLDLYNFDGRVTVDGETLPLTTNEIVYRGSILRNTTQALGMVINTGEECKIRMNANKNPRIKAPSLQTVVNKVVIIVVVFVLCLASFCTAAYQVWYKFTESESWYLRHARVASGPILTSFIIMFNTMIPLSLYVSLEIIKVGQLFLMHDVDMYDPITDTPMEAHTTTINEELGQISYIFSDKTGTLTDNIMRFRKLSVAGTAWLHDVDLQKEAAELESQQALLELNKKGKGKKTKESHFSADYSMDDSRPSESRRGSVAPQWKSTARPAKGQPELRTEDLLQYLKHKPHGVFARKARFFLLSLALCHTCLPEKKEDGSIDFQAASPDELALVRAAQELGYLVVNRAAQTITLRSHPNGPHSPVVEETYEVLDVIEFSSKRKRMSIIVRFPDGRRCIFCKGADSVVMTRLKMAPLAVQKVAEVERRASIRKSLEVESALRKLSDAPPRASLERTSLSVSRRSIGGAAMAVASTHNTVPAREQLDSWLKTREQDVDLSSVDNPSAYTSPVSINAPRDSFQSVYSSSNEPVQDDEYYESLVDEALAVNEAEVFERCFQHIDDFATEGLRTLLYGYKFLDEREYLGWKKIYHDATTSLVNRQEMVEVAGEMIEQDLDLAGATAIEDKLQKGVPETIDKLRRANIRMWMLTGDKRETAINIGHSCRLIKDYSKVIILDHSTGTVEQVVAKSLLEISQGGVPHSVVVVDGQTLSEIESDETLALLFFDLAIIADSVICCRASPSQKASLVKEIRTRVNGSVTLAIGDGANDIAMIQEAHVGIGIAGKEGLQAARVSDYSIGQFRFLQKLLLVHGRWNYIRTAKYVLGTFWKEMLFYLTQALYQRFNGYTGTSLYEPWSMSMFNTLFTSLPVIFLGIFEQDIRASTLLAVPELYTHGQRNEAFSIKKYFWWMFMATCEAMLAYFLMFGLYARTNSTDISLFAMGDLSFSVCVVVIATKLLVLECHTITFVNFVGWWLSVGGWILWNISLSAVYSQKESTVYAVKGGFLGHFGANPTWWLVVIITVLSVCVFEVGVSALRKIYFPNDVDVFQELEKDPVLRRRFEESASGDSATTTAIQAEHDTKREGEVQDLLDGRGGDYKIEDPFNNTAPAAQPKRRLHSDAMSPTDTIASMRRKRSESGVEEHELTTITSGMPMGR